MNNASDTRAIRKAQKAAKVAESERQGVVVNLMSSPAGRGYVYDQLTRCHVFSPSFNLSALAMAFAEGERNSGLQLLGDVMAFAPDQYVQMMREANDRRSANDNNSEAGRSSANGRGPDSGPEPDDADGGLVSEYEPGLVGE